ncbi:MAG: HEAT repeat domain-containing protein [Candidatus Heimdallarchaeota archaeon]|nr:HEAT repeat domain-containing protein [Candidatus Heimdallarchaeota archaeon]
MDIHKLLTDLKSKNKSTREKAVDELALAQDLKTLEILIQILKKDKHGSVRRRAALALGRIGSEDSKEALNEAMSIDKDEETRKNSAIALGNLGDERAILPLYEFLQKPKENNFFDSLDRARINKVLNELAQRKMQGTVEKLVHWRKQRIDKTD